jgi:hypothetical protein
MCRKSLMKIINEGFYVKTKSVQAEKQPSKEE